MALTELEVKRVKAGEKAHRVPDGFGLYLWVMPTGGKLWRWDYRFGGAKKTMALGSYPVVSLAQARAKHGEGRKLLAMGIDPMARRKSDKAAARSADADSFASVARLWWDHWRAGKSERHAVTTWERLKANVLPKLGPRPIREIEAPELVAMVKGIEQRGAADIAKRALQTVGQVFRYAIAHGHAQRNPAGDFKPSDVLRPTRKINYARIDARELPGLLRQVEVYPGKHVTRLAIKLMALTFVRTGELIRARWEEFDLEAARWDIPAERMKMRTPHIVPLSRQALEVLASLRDLSEGTEYVFPGERRGKPISNMTILKGLERMGYKGRMTGHGFRGLASTLLHEQGYAHEHIELQLAHAPRNAVSAAYNHALYLAPRTRMMQEWADHLDRARQNVVTMVPRERMA